LKSIHLLTLHPLIIEHTILYNVFNKNAVVLRIMIDTFLMKQWRGSFYIFLLLSDIVITLLF